MRAGVPVEIEVPVNAGLVMLPSVGAVGPVDAEMATVRSADGHTEVAAAAGASSSRAAYRDRANCWHPLRPVRAGSLKVLIDDVDPFRMPAASNPATAVDPLRGLESSLRPGRCSISTTGRWPGR